MTALEQIVEADPIPLVDLSRQHEELRDEVLAVVARIVDKGDFVLGAEVERFERDLASFCGADHAVGVGNGTDAVELALRATGIGPGDEVILPANTFVATAEAVVRAGATVVLADCEQDHLLLDPNAVAAAIGPRTAAVIPVHLYGQAAAVEQIRSVVGPGIVIVEDAAQAQGARRLGRSAMALGDVAATSFYPGKNLGAWGDAGAVLTSDDAVARRLRAVRNHGSERRYLHDQLGFNSRLDTIQAAVLRSKLRRLDDWNTERRIAATRYDALLAGVPGLVTPSRLAGNEHVWHLYVVRVQPVDRVAQRDRVLERLQAAGIGAGIHYPVPVHLHRAFADLGHGAGAFPVAERAAGEILSLPLFPGITADEQERVAAELIDALAAP